MDIKIIKIGLDAIKDFRVLFLQENHFQFVHDKCHLYGWADTWMIELDGQAVGYGSVWGTDRREDRDTLFEFYLLPPARSFASPIFKELLRATDVHFIDCQTNDPLLSTMTFQFTQDILTEAVLFKDHFQSTLPLNGAVFSREAESDEGPNAGGYILSLQGQIVASGGFLMNYNMPYADIYMDVKEHARRQGFGSLIVQELKKEVYRRRRIPAARCNPGNHASKATLQKAGFAVCGAWLKGKVIKGGR